MNMLDLRGTGRTTRMLQEAVESAKNGEKVLVVGGATHLLQYWIELLRRENPSIAMYRGDGIVMFNKGHIKFITIKDGETSLLGTLQNAGQEQGVGKVFVDHGVIETTLAPVLAMLHRWDKNENDTPGAGGPPVRPVLRGDAPGPVKKRSRKPRGKKRRNKSK